MTSKVIGGIVEKTLDHDTVTRPSWSNMLDIVEVGDVRSSGHPLVTM